MENDKPKIEIDDPVGAINAKFDLYIKFVVGVLIVAFITMIFMVATLLLDAWHFNSAIYKEYSEKTASVEATQKTNEILLGQIKDLLEQDKQDRETIKQLLNKK